MESAEKAATTLATLSDGFEELWREFGSLLSKYEALERKMKATADEVCDSMCSALFISS